MKLLLITPLESVHKDIIFRKKGKSDANFAIDKDIDLKPIESITLAYSPFNLNPVVFSLLGLLNCPHKIIASFT